MQKRKRLEAVDKQTEADSSGDFSTGSSNYAVRLHLFNLIQQKESFSATFWKFLIFMIFGGLVAQTFKLFELDTINDLIEKTEQLFIRSNHLVNLDMTTRSALSAVSEETVVNLIACWRQSIFWPVDPALYPTLDFIRDTTLKSLSKELGLDRYSVIQFYTNQSDVALLKMISAQKTYINNLKFDSHRERALMQKASIFGEPLEWSNAHVGLYAIKQNIKMKMMGIQRSIYQVVKSTRKSFQFYYESIRGKEPPWMPPVINRYSFHIAVGKLVLITSFSFNDLFLTLETNFEGLIKEFTVYIPNLKSKQFFILMFSSLLFKSTFIVIVFYASLRAQKSMNEMLTLYRFLKSHEIIFHIRSLFFCRKSLEQHGRNHLLLLSKCKNLKVGHYRGVSEFLSYTKAQEAKKISQKRAHKLYAKASSATANSCLKTKNQKQNQPTDLPNQVLKVHFSISTTPNNKVNEVSPRKNLKSCLSETREYAKSSNYSDPFEEAKMQDNELWATLMSTRSPSLSLRRVRPCHIKPHRARSLIFLICINLTYYCYLNLQSLIAFGLQQRVRRVIKVQELYTTNYQKMAVVSDNFIVYINMLSFGNYVKFKRRFMEDYEISPVVEKITEQGLLYHFKQYLPKEDMAYLEQLMHGDFCSLLENNRAQEAKNRVEIPEEAFLKRDLKICRLYPPSQQGYIGILRAETERITSFVSMMKAHQQNFLNQTKHAEDTTSPNIFVVSKSEEIRLRRMHEVGLQMFMSGLYELIHKYLLKEFQQMKWLMKILIKVLDALISIPNFIIFWLIWLLFKRDSQICLETFQNISVEVVSGNNLLRNKIFTRT